MYNRIPANATFVVTPGGLQPMGGGQPMMRQMAPAPMLAMPQQFARPRMSLNTAGWMNLLDIVEGGLAIYFARPSTVAAPPVVADAATNTLNQAKYNAALSGSLVDAERNRILINEGGRILRSVLRYVDTRQAIGRGPLF